MRGWALFILVSLICAATSAMSARADVITHIPTNDRVVALTFDACEAGQRVSFDNGVLNYLLSRRIPFTVFASGKFVEDNKEDVSELAKLDFVEIENHSWSHPNTMNHYGEAAVLEQVRRAEESIVAATGRTPQFFRFPAGNYNERGLRAVENLGYKVLHWRWATGDPDPRESAEALYSRVIANVQPGDILIFHINGRGVHTAEALPRVVEELEAEGYRFVLISDYIGRPRPKDEPAPQPSTIASLRQQFDNLLARAPLLAIPQALD
jgi:peptidoglycan/xylan/chitin deacetylase (PgdA/CDA1 family)